MPDTSSGTASLRLTVDLDALAANWRTLAARSNPAECAAVVKADAYGIGIDRAVPALWAAGCRTFFVALPDEGRRARVAAPDADIYVLHGFWPEAAETFHRQRLRPALNSLAEIETWARLMPGQASAIHVDTGMNRLGLSVDEAQALADRPDLLRQVSPRLLISHLVCSDVPDHPLNRAQLLAFRALRSSFPGLPASLANSGGVFLGREFHFDMVRPGISLYGATFAEDQPLLQSVSTLEARVLVVREAKAGETVGYGATETLVRDTRIAILSAGYADGYQRGAGSRPSHRHSRAVLHDRSAPILGRVSMDLIAVDVTDLPAVMPGDWAELFGPNLLVDDVAAAAGTIGYELLTGLSRRAERIYVNGGGTT